MEIRKQAEFLKVLHKFYQFPKDLTKNRNWIKELQFLAKIWNSLKIYGIVWLIFAKVQSMLFSKLLLEYLRNRCSKSKSSQRGLREFNFRKDFSKELYIIWCWKQNFLTTEHDYNFHTCEISRERSSGILQDSRLLKVNKSVYIA